MALLRLKLALPLPLLVLLVDCTTKELAVTTLSPEHVPHPIAGDVLRLTLAYNRDGAMSLPLGQYGRWPLIAIGVVIVAALLQLLWRTPTESAWRRTALGLLIGGALGNIGSRIWNPRGVVDFIDIGIGSWRFFTFNVADIAVFLGACILAVTLWREQPRQRWTPG
jgi:signal peptidase II